MGSTVSPGSERADASRLKAILAGYCPRCRRGAIFKSALPAVCGLLYVREAGYFLGAMYVSYGLGVLTLLPVAMALVVLLDAHLAIVFAAAAVQTLASVPLFVRYSRAIWLHVDQMIDPR